MAPHTPYDLWLSGRDDNPLVVVRAWNRLHRLAGAPRRERQRRTRLRIVQALAGRRPRPWALQVVELSGGRIGEFTFFLDTAVLFPLFDLPARPDP